MDAVAARAALVEEHGLRARATGNRTVARVHWAKHRTERGSGCQVLHDTQEGAVDKRYLPTLLLPRAAEGDVVTFQEGEAPQGPFDVVRVGATNLPFAARLVTRTPEYLELAGAAGSPYCRVPCAESLLPPGLLPGDFMALKLEDGRVTEAAMVCTGAPETRAGACPICGSATLVAATCEAHAVCPECLQGYLLANLKEKAQYPLKCPGAFGCNALLDINGPPRQLLPAEDFAVLEAHSVAAALGERLMATCTQCGYLQYCGRSRRDCSGRCQKCKAVFCARCGSCDPTHLGRPCDVYQQTRAAQDGSDLVAALAGQLGWQACPLCGTLVEKNGGCNHMTHRRCPNGGDTHFCYCCGVLLINSSQTQDGARHFPNGPGNACTTVQRE